MDFHTEKHLPGGGIPKGPGAAGGPGKASVFFVREKKYFQGVVKSIYIYTHMYLIRATFLKFFFFRLSLHDGGGDLATEIRVPQWNHALWGPLCTICIHFLVLSEQFHSCGVLHLVSDVGNSYGEKLWTSKGPTPPMPPPQGKTTLLHKVL